MTGCYTSPDLFKLITFKWVPFDVERMTRSYNTHLPRFNSKFWCPGTEAVDCFTQDLIGGKNVTIHLPRGNRLCSLCNSNQVDDEIHFFFQYNKYSVQRQAFINQINRIIPDFDKKSSPESIKLIMNSKEHHVNKLVMKFISSFMKIRDSLLAV